MNIESLIGPVIRTNLFITFLYVLIGFIFKKFLTRIIKNLVSRVDDGDNTKNSMIELRAQTIGSLTENAVKVVIWGIIFTMILSQWGVNIAPVLAGAGILGLAVGFGAQTLVKDIVTGFFILFENQFNVGDTVEIAGVKGKVKALRLRTTILKGKDGQIYIIPNSKIDKVARN